MKVYAVVSRNWTSIEEKIESIHRTFEGANEAMQSLADYLVGDGSRYCKHQDFKNEISVHYIPDEYDEEVSYSLRETYLIIERELLK